MIFLVLSKEGAEDPLFLFAFFNNSGHAIRAKRKTFLLIIND